MCKPVAITLLVFILATQLKAQPYIDPFNARYTNGVHKKNTAGTPFQHLYIGSDLPVKLKNGGYFIFSPFFENWNIDSATNTHFLPAVSSIALPVIAQMPFENKSWGFTVGIIPRFNGHTLLTNSNAFQFGGLATIHHTVNPTLNYRLGVYINNEQFGVFIVPLAGINWKINSRNYLFGLLPGRLTYEHKLSTHFYVGGNFRSITNSYLLPDNHYLRIDDNQLSAYIDSYVTKNIVLSGEAGYGIFRQLRKGYGRNKNYVKDFSWNDGAFLRLSASYRIRL